MIHLLKEAGVSGCSAVGPGLGFLICKVGLHWHVPRPLRTHCELLVFVQDPLALCKPLGDWGEFTLVIFGG